MLYALAWLYSLLACYTFTALYVTGTV